MAKPKIKSDGRTITVRVPISIRKRGGRKVVLAPNGVLMDTRKLFGQRVDNAMVKALARAFRWRAMLEENRYATIREMATAENINVSYVSRVLRLTLLAPDIVERVLKGEHPTELGLALLMKAFATVWVDQRSITNPASRRPARRLKKKTKAQAQAQAQGIPTRGSAAR